MKTHYISGMILACAFFACAPHAALAYFTTGQGAVQLSDTAAMYAIEYTFGHEDNDIFMPILAERGLGYDSTRYRVGYSLRDDVATTENGTTVGMVLSNAPIVDGMYHIAKGTAVKLTLFVILTTNTDTPETDYALQVDRLPFIFVTEDGKRMGQHLNDTELQYYVTDEIELNSEDKE